MCLLKHDTAYHINYRCQPEVTADNMPILDPRANELKNLFKDQE